MNYAALLEGKNAVILGDNAVGRAIAELFSEHGAKVCLSEIGDSDVLENTLKSVSFEHIHVLVVNPTAPMIGDMLSTTDEDDTWQLQMHQRTIMQTMRAFWNNMRFSGGGATVIISSNTVLRVILGDAVFTAAKGASGGMTRVSGLENAEENMRVNEIMTGEVAPDAIADVALFLASDLSSFITGESITADGGASRRAFLGRIN